MQILTENQKNILIITFFKLDKYEGSYSIGKSLLEEGECVVAGTDSIYGGKYINRYIKYSKAINFIDCIMYQLDYDKFIKDWFVKEQINNHIKDIKTKLKNTKQSIIIMESEIAEMEQLIPKPKKKLTK